MQIPRYTKPLLYNEIESFRRYIDVKPQDYPIDTRKIAEAGGLTVDTCDFITKGLRGALVVDGAKGHIILDSKENDQEQNFFCGHESIHFVLHRNIGLNSFQCFDNARPNQNSIIEWQANEGAAELIVPYKQLIPDLLDLFNPITAYGDIFEAFFKLSEKYQVSEMVIRNRTESLKYEIYQVASGVPIDSISIMSKKQQERAGINVPSCYDVGLQKCFWGMA
ncbi:ImmA/IrrE family metallo-endopeptidase [Oscillibacter sp.]|uniref:ImmA/IrrE family metallo-endopeptidase n=1 Tax=Oscillibacter sp. TaxID=1945593 RepID=UPI001B6A1922|nr:ImmA/IrrE family metallo-endopeptidase [Oscillibacter sp.]MBP3508775.1 ImmA/IrrE family metallo-endopeptidase [Oscillibacter sp.]